MENVLLLHSVQYGIITSIRLSELVSGVAHTRTRFHSPAVQNQFSIKLTLNGEFVQTIPLAYGRHLNRIIPHFWSNEIEILSILKCCGIAIAFHRHWSRLNIPKAQSHKLSSRGTASSVTLMVRLVV